MAVYVNSRTGAVLESDAGIKGGGWEPSLAAGDESAGAASDGAGKARSAPAAKGRKAGKDG